MKKIFGFAAFFALLLSAVTSVPAAAGVNDFEIQDYQIDYYLARDAENRSTLKTVETITAMFPDADQNHGIERAIPTNYDGHSTNLEVVEVSDPGGKRIPYSIYHSAGNTVLQIGNSDRYVHGLQRYKITYTQRDVTKYFSDTNDDEFYWDTNGTGWAVPINALSVRAHVDDKLAGALSNNQKCYLGSIGATGACNITREGGDFAARATNLQPGENMTIAVGFAAHTFAPYKMSAFEAFVAVWQISLLVTLPIAIISIIWLAITAYRRSNRLAELKVIVPEYVPPKSVSVSTAGRISNTYQHVFSAQLIDLAVRHYVKIYQTREKSFFKQANYELEIIKDIASLKPEEREILEDVFPATHIGARLDMATLKNNAKTSVKLSDNQKKLDKDITGQYALRARDQTQFAWFKKAALILFVAAAVTLSPWLLVASITSLIIAFVLKPLTDTGLALSRYLKGLELYIKVAESERLRMLQSPEGAAKIGAPIDVNDKRQLIKLYERVLPYAILFGQEKNWNKQLGQYYESVHESPSWYAGNNVMFNAALFSAAISDFNQVATYSDPTSSGSGGSGGGGFSGGGGGGGGGGGW